MKDLALDRCALGRRSRVFRQPIEACGEDRTDRSGERGVRVLAEEDRELLGEEWVAARASCNLGLELNRKREALGEALDEVLRIRSC